MAAGALKTYNLAQVLITIGGLPFEGFGESDAVTFAPNSSVYESAVGADGEVTRSATNDRSGTLTFTLMSTSSSNDVFSAFLLLSKTVGIGDTFPVYIKDLNSKDTLIASKCYIQDEAEMAFGRAATEREWTIYAANVSTIHGGDII